MNPISESEYEIQFYSMSLQKINSLITEELTEIFFNNIDQMYTTFKGKYKNMDSGTEEKLILEKANVKKMIIAKLETPIEKFQTHLYNSLRIPDNVLLPEDEIFANPMDSNIVEELNLTISNLEKEILKTKYEIQKISSKKQKMENLSKEIEELKTSLMNVPNEDYDNNIAVDISTSLMKMKQKAVQVLSQNGTTENNKYIHLK